MDLEFNDLVAYGVQAFLKVGTVFGSSRLKFLKFSPFHLISDKALWGQMWINLRSSNVFIVER